MHAARAGVVAIWSTSRSLKAGLGHGPCLGRRDRRTAAWRCVPSTTIRALALRLAPAALRRERDVRALAVVPVRSASPRGASGARSARG